MINLVEIVEDGGQYNLREVVVNSAHIISIVADDFSAGLHANGKLPKGLHEAQQFSKVSFTNGTEMVIVGNPNILGEKAKKLLHG